MQSVLHAHRYAQDATCVASSKYAKYTKLIFNVVCY